MKTLMTKKRCSLLLTAVVMILSFGLVTGFGEFVQVVYVGDFVSADGAVQSDQFYNAVPGSGLLYLNFTENDKAAAAKADKPNKGKGNGNGKAKGRDKKEKYAKSTVTVNGQVFQLPKGGGVIETPLEVYGGNNEIAVEFAGKPGQSLHVEVTAAGTGPMLQ
jgi:hypothetical protein